MEANREQAEVDEGALYKVAYDEAARALSEQLTAIDNLRGRAGWLLSAAAITTSVLSGQTLANGHSGAIVWLAMASFVAVAVVSLVILWPRRAEFSVDPNQIIRGYIEAKDQAPLQELHRDLALHMHRSHFANLAALTRLAALFQVASGLLIAEMILWVVAITMA